MLERIDAAGGTLQAIEQGLIQREIQDAAYRAQQRIDSGDAIVVGVNRYQATAAAPIEVLRIDPQLEQQQRARVAAGARLARRGPLALGDRCGGDRAPSPAATSCRRSSTPSRPWRPSARSRTR